MPNYKLLKLSDYAISVVPKIAPGSAHDPVGGLGDRGGSKKLLRNSPGTLGPNVSILPSPKLELVCAVSRVRDDFRSESTQRSPSE